MSVEKIRLGRADFPEQAGVSSAAVADFITDVENSNIEMHSVMILRSGKVAFECWREPYAPDIPHTMYSISKSVTSVAVGFAVEEGLLSLDTKVADILLEFRPAKRDERLEKLTVYHLLTMTAGKEIGFLSGKAGSDWLKEYFNARWVFEPGTSWRYISECQFILSAVLNRVTGMGLVDYLMPRLFEPLGFDRTPFWEKDSNGIEAGGWGVYLTTEECAKFMLCCSRGGVFEGKQVIPAGWIKDAVSKLVDNRRERDDEPDTGAGYGYCFWRNALPDSYRADGMFSQFGIVFEKTDAVIVVTANHMNERRTRECIWRHFPAAFIEPCSEPCADAGIKDKLAFEPLKEIPEAPRSGLERTIAGKTMGFKKPKLLNAINYPVSMIPLPVLFMSADRAGNIDRVRFTFSANECAMSWNEGAVANTIICGMDGKARKSKIKLAGFEFTACSSAAWENENTLCVWTRPLESICQRRLRFVFNGEKAAFKPSTFPDAKFMLEYVSERVKIYHPNPVGSKIGETAAQICFKFVEPVHRGTIR